MPIQIDLGNSSPSTPVAVKPGPVVGIDLGTTNSLIAISEDGIKARVLTDENGEAVFPSVLRIDPIDGRIVARGLEARRDRARHFGTTAFSIKRFMGRSLADVSAEPGQLPFELVAADAGSAAEGPGQVRLKVGDRSYSPVELSADILRSLKMRAEAALGQPVARAVITVPAYFDDAQRSATKAAGRVAGFEVLRVLNEPTAAALAYGWSNERPGRVAVFDLGGGTFDISILRIEENVFEVLATAGDTHLGGDDFDWELANWALSKLAERRPDLKPASDTERKQLIAELLNEAEAVKIRLSQADATDFSLRGEAFAISRAEAEALWKPLVDRALGACAQSLADARLRAADLDDVVLVGGSTRVPYVRRRVEEFFGRPPNAELNPDEAVALGAALQAHSLGTRTGDRLLLDVIPLSLGIETMGGAVTKLIPRNSTLPTEAREVFTNHAEKQNAFDIHIVQGERELVKDCRSLARFKLRGLEPAPAGFHRMEVLFRVDANGILNVRARDLRSEKTHEIEVKPSFGITDDELTDMLEASIESAESDMVARQLIDLKVETQTVVAAADKAVANAGHLVAPDELAEIKARLIDLKNASRGPSLEALQRSLDEFNAVSHDLAELQMNNALQSALAGKSTDEM